ncbi:uncharacterized protein A4U43_C08F24940 [Asparagus officinalis]|nr:uncharacterized protein A4U43_C08F24940 [Asparagus officinalis]
MKEKEEAKKIEKPPRSRSVGVPILKGREWSFPSLMRAEKREKEDASDRAHAVWTELEELQTKLNEEVDLQETLCQEVVRATTKDELKLDYLHA